MTAQLANAVSTSLAQAAIELARAGWAVFPSIPRSKLPAIKEWPDKATNDVDQVRAWWAQWPDANISHCPGRSGSFAIDLDGPQGFESWRQLQRVHGRAPATLAVVSPRAEGGVHLYWQAPAFYVKSTAGKLAEGVDVRGTRGQAVLPPSVRADGTAYRWADPSARIAEPPGWLVALLRPRPPVRTVHGGEQITGSASGRLSGLVRFVASATAPAGDQPGDRNSRLFWASCRAGELVAAGGVSDDEARRALADAAAHVDLDQHEAAATIASGFRNGGAL